MRVKVERGSTRDISCEEAARPPAPHLASYILKLNGYSERTSGLLRRYEFPGARVVLIFEFGPPLRVGVPGRRPEQSVRHAGGFVAGLDDGLTRTEHDGYQSGLQLDLTPLGARLFLGLPLSELTGQVASFADVLPEHRYLAEQLYELPDWAARFDCVERLVEESVMRSSVDLGAVSWALDYMGENAAAGTRELAEGSGYSQKHLIQLFRDRVGVSPKQLRRIQRFDRLLDFVRAAGEPRWSELAQELGYYDQAHLIRDVRDFAGVTPVGLRALFS